MLPLDGCRAKIARADENIKQLEGEIKAFLDTHPYGLDWTHDAQRKTVAWTAKAPPEHPLRWSVIAGEVVHELRSALDHLAWQLVIANGETPDKRTEFPVFEKRGTYRTEGVKRLRGMSRAARDQIEQCQPFQAGTALAEHALFIVHELNRIDKHQLLNVVGSAIRPNKIQVGGVPGTYNVTGMTTVLPDQVRPFNNGAEMFTLQYQGETPPDGYAGVDLELEFTVAFEEDGPGRGKPTIKLLTDLSGKVFDTIASFLPLFDPKSPRPVSQPQLVIPVSTGVLRRRYRKS